MNGKLASTNGVFIRDPQLYFGKDGILRVRGNRSLEEYLNDERFVSRRKKFLKASGKTEQDMAISTIEHHHAGSMMQIWGA